MAEYSYPVVDEPMSAEQWAAVTRGIGSGVLDQGGFPYNMSGAENVNNTLKITVATTSSTTEKYAQAIVRGFYHKMDAAKTLTVPAVTKKTTYYIALQYDPLRTTGPVVLDVFTSLDRTQGKDYVVLWQGVRNANMLLTNVAWTMVRPRIAPVIVVASDDNLPPADSVLWGTVGIVHNGRSSTNSKIVMAINDSDTWFWKTIYDPNDNAFVWTEFADTTTYTNPGHGFRRAIGRRGKQRRLRGRVSLKSGNDFRPGGEYTILSGDISSSDAPVSVQRFITGIGGTSNVGVATVEVSSTGAVAAYVSQNTAWIGLDGIEWEAR